jgi:ADP-ribosyl-[dinitrogen reductase] hydrolase
MKIEDRIKGCIYGVAAGDALGACWEGWRPTQIMGKFGRVTEMESFGTWQLGEFTDDTWLTLAAARAYSGDEFDPESAAKAMVIWMSVNGRGIGVLTNRALAHIRSGRAQWYEAGTKALASMGNNRGAGNGSLMRCSPTGLVRKYTDLDRIIDESSMVSEMTHSDMRCKAACSGYNILLAAIFDDVDPQQALNTAWIRTQPMNAEVSDTFQRAIRREDSYFDVNDMQGIGYVVRALDRALVAYTDAIDGDSGFEEYICDIVTEGGDCDTNAAIAGGLLGAYYGFDVIPKRWVDKLMWKDELDEAVDLLVEFRGK